ncbi:TPA: cyclic di-GMP phosphodiesterase, partial [Pseudomonas aeruginosa]
EEEIRHAALLCSRAKAAVVSMFHDARMGQAIDTAHASDLVDEISASVLRHPNALVSLVRLKTSDEYTYMHSVAVCALMIALARQLELSDPLVHEAGLAGLLHDIGKMAVPDPILNKPGKLTEQEFGLVRRHPQNGARMLLDCRQVSALVVDVCLHHHERINGTGYPFGLAQEQISLLARMGAVCDVYDAITSDRPYKKGWNAAEAIRRMAEWNGHFDPQVFRAFVKAVGIYPVGALVRLESGRLGVVLEQHGRSLLTPRVKVFFSARSKVPIPQQVVDLGRAGQTDRIVGFEPAEAWNFRNLDEMWTGLAKTTGSYFDAGTGNP